MVVVPPLSISRHARRVPTRRRGSTCCARTAREGGGRLGVRALLEPLDISPAQGAVAVNGEVVPRSEWPRARVSDGDAVEIVRAVGGGAPGDTKKEPLFMEALFLLLVFGAGLAPAPP